MPVANWLNGFTVTVLVIATLLIITWSVFRPGWMGFRSKTLWDWFALMSFPVLLATVTFQLNQGQLQVEQQRAQEEAVQSYIDRVSELILTSDDLTNDPRLKAVIEARTEVTLNLVTGERAARILRFLMSLDLLDRLTFDLRELNLSRAELKGIVLRNKTMESALFYGADLEDGDFSGSDFEEADLRYTDFKKANLQNVSFEEANLKGAELDYADLRGADLSEATGLSSRMIDASCVDTTTLVPENVSLPDLPARGCNSSGDDDD